jgi:hypothetical protein
MKKKGPRSIPDFSGKRKPANPNAATPDPKAQPGPPPPVRNIKPQATSSKSGRRGS